MTDFELADRVAFNVEEAAQLCGVSVRTIRRAYQTGRLAYSQPGSRVLFTRADLDRWIASQRVDLRSHPTRLRAVGSP